MEAEVRRLWLLGVLLPFLFLVLPRGDAGDRVPWPWGHVRDGGRDRTDGDVWAKGERR